LKKFQKYFLIFLKKIGPDLAHPSWDGPDPVPILWAGLSPAAWAGLMFQPIANKRAGYCAAHSNQPNIIRAN